MPGRRGDPSRRESSVLDPATTRPPRFLGHPLRICPALGPRPGRRAKPSRHAGAAPAHSTTKAPTRSNFRGSITRLMRSLSTLRPRGRPRPTQDSLPAAGYALPGGIDYPQGGYERFLMPVSHLPPPPGLAWRDECLLSTSPQTVPSSAIRCARCPGQVPGASCLPSSPSALSWIPTPCVRDKHPALVKSEAIPESVLERIR